MLSVQSVSVELGGRTILDGISLVVNSGEAVGIVGPNGCGKTTLLRVIAGELHSRSGSVVLPPGTRIGYLRQGHSGAGVSTVGDVFPTVFGRDSATERLSELAQRMADAPDQLVNDLADEYDTLVARLAAPTTLDLAAIASELALRPVSSDEPVQQLSGGELTKLGLMALAASRPDVLLLDEPTNHLDMRGIEWVQQFVTHFPGPVVIVSHDRTLLDECASHVFEIDPHTGKGELFADGYSDYANEKARREAEAWESYRRQQREEQQLKRVISAIESRSRAIEQQTINFYFRKRAKKVARRATTLKARLNRQIESAEHLERPDKPHQGFYATFQSDEGGASLVLSAERVAIDVEGKTLFEDLSFVVRRGQRVVLTGPNGSGKTTLLRAILGQHPIAAGKLALSASARKGYLPQQDDSGNASDNESVTPIELLRRANPMTESEAYNLLHRFLFGHNQLTTPVARLSYGERKRLSLAVLVLGGADLLLLDEPTNHLDLPSRESFETALEGFAGTALIVTHDRYFIERFADLVIDLDQDGPSHSKPVAITNGAAR